MPSILYIEDSEALQKMYSFGLQHEGYTIDVASDGGEGLARLQESHYDILLLDLMLSGMSGLDILKAYDIRKNSPGTKIVVLTNLDNPSVKERVQESHVDGYLIKSDYTPSKLAAYLKGLDAAPDNTPSQP